MFLSTEEWISNSTLRMVVQMNEPKAYYTTALNVRHLLRERCTLQKCLSLLGWRWENTTHEVTHKQQAFISHSLVAGSPWAAEVLADSVSVVSPFLAFGGHLLFLSSFDRMRDSNVFLFLSLHGGSTSWPHLNLITPQMRHLQIPSTYDGGTQTFSLERENTSIYHLLNILKSLIIPYGCVYK